MKNRRQVVSPKGGLESNLQQIQMRWAQSGPEQTPPDAAPETSNRGKMKEKAAGYFANKLVGLPFLMRCRIRYGCVRSPIVACATSCSQ